MLQFFAGIFYQALCKLREVEKKIAQDSERAHGDPFLSKGQIQQVYDALRGMQHQSTYAPFLGDIFEGSLYSDLSLVIPDVYSSMRLADLNGQLKALRRAIEDELWMNVFMFIPRDQASFYEGNRASSYMIKHRANEAPSDIDMLFGQKVNDNFPGARGDINEAGNCYASGRNTACAFHLTRVLERGLFVLAQDASLFGLTNPALQIGVKDAALETWETLINKVESAITNIQKVQRSGQKIRTLELYSGAAMHFRYFKDHWRNPISHSRASYDEPQAHSGMTKVREFMKYLAETIGLEEKPGMILP